MAYADRNEVLAMYVDVYNLSTGEIRTYGPTIGPREALILAYRQSRGDYNTWNDGYFTGVAVTECELTMVAGDWSVFRDGRQIRR